MCTAEESNPFILGLLTDFYTEQAIDDYTKFTPGSDQSSNVHKSPMMKGEDPMLNVEEVNNVVLNDFLKQAQQKGNGSLEEDSLLSDWMRKPVVKWSVTDTLSWIFTEAENCGLDFMDTNMPSFSTTSGSQLMVMTEEDFVRRIPDADFARQIYVDLQKVIQTMKHEDTPFHSYDVFSSVQEFLPDHYTDGAQQLVPTMYSNNYLDLNQNTSLYELTSAANNNNKMQGFEPLGDDSGIEDIGSDTELQNEAAVSPQAGFERREQMRDDWSAYDFPSQVTDYGSEANNCDGRLSHQSSEGSRFSYGSGSTGYASSHDEDEPPAPVKKRPGRPRGIRKKKPEKLGRLWEFIRDLLQDTRYCPSIICWEDYDRGVFRFVQSEKVAKLWGQKKENKEMTFEKFSRAMRYYYKSKVLVAVQRRLVYQFGPTAQHWRTANPILRGHL